MSCDIPVQTSGVKTVTGALLVAEHPVGEVTVTEYVSGTVMPLAPVGFVLVLVSVPEAGLSLHKYTYGAIPPVMVTS